jgi:peptidoglycan/LPS O-acetylase OafA/YrhL
MRLTKSSSILLDLIRGVSAQLVVIGHLFSFYNIFGLRQHENRFLMQEFGVVIFFILSGFLIGYSVDNKSEKHAYTFRHFFLDRFSRIFIAYLPALFVITLLDAAAYKISGSTAYTDAQNIKTFVGNIFMLQDFPIQNALNKIFKSHIHITSFGSARPLWTVAVEWWIYLLFGFIYFKRITWKNIIFLLPLLIVPLFKVGTGGNGLSILWFLSLLGYYLIKNNIFKNNYFLLIALLIMASVVRLLFNEFKVYDLAFSVPLMIALFVFVAYLQKQTKPNYFFLKIKPVSSTLAAFSFSLYLLHYSIIEFVRSLNLGLNVFIEAGLLFVLCNLISWLFAKATEYKYHRFRTYLTEKFL